MVADTSTPSLTGFVTANRKTSSLHVIDGGKTYTPLRCIGYRHPTKTQHDTGQELGRWPRVHRIFGNLQTWLHGTHHGLVTTTCRSTSGEFAFRFNPQMAAFPTPASAHNLQPVAHCGANRISRTQDSTT
ncbi:MAG: transposase [Nitrospirae bacterium]|nr:transposase [Nitrospirota bacterium]